jgi:hypothetical protein
MRNPLRYLLSKLQLILKQFYLEVQQNNMPRANDDIEGLLAEAEADVAAEQEIFGGDYAAHYEEPPIPAERKAVMKSATANKSQPIALPNGRGRTITLNHIIAAYNNRHATIIDFRVPMNGETYLASSGQWHIQGPSSGYPIINTPKFVLKKSPQAP